MVATGWKKMLAKTGRSQKSFAQRLGVNVVEMNMVCQGRAFLDPYKFDRACELLECRPTDLYAQDALEFLYGADRKAPVVPKRMAQVRLEQDVQELVDFVANDEHLTRAQAANAIIRRAFETRRIEHV